MKIRISYPGQDVQVVDAPAHLIEGLKAGYKFPFIEIVPKPRFKFVEYGVVIHPTEFTSHRVRLWSNGETFTLYTVNGPVEVVKLFKIGKSYEAT